jgi:hypothetical protein
MTVAEQQELAEILAEMGYDRASRTWKRQPFNRLSSWLISAACIGGACVLAAFIHSSQQLPISVVPFYLGVASAVWLGGRKSGWYAFAMTTPVICLAATVAELSWLGLSVAAFVVIASIPRQDRHGGAPGHQPGSRAPSRPLSSSRRVAPPAAPSESMIGA